MTTAKQEGTMGTETSARQQRRHDCGGKMGRAFGHQSDNIG
eukprot:CAMPEP_0171944128 /NCGR_PEP_ID=MMETSP0993-20121228/40353_1 /TAXON_ID=483369 /ORGANISM="non described non described, Strain CCMP2098" /LENGTH=40 /DNA_ID= /DNA_START= /DNA_END= /DNA_ORIENTATION=